MRRCGQQTRPSNASDQATDLAEQYAFLTQPITRRSYCDDVLGSSYGGGRNFGFFDPWCGTYSRIETTGDAAPDQFIRINFSKRTGTTTPQRLRLLCRSADFQLPDRSTLAGTPNLLRNYRSRTGVSFLPERPMNPGFSSTFRASRIPSIGARRRPDAPLTARRDIFAATTF